MSTKKAQIKELEEALLRQRKVTKLAEREERKAIRKLEAMRYERRHGVPPPTVKTPRKVKLVKLAGSPLLSRHDVMELRGATLFEPQNLDAAIIAIHKRGGKVVAVYDRSMMLRIYADLFTLDYGDRDAAWQSAIEWVEHNIVDAVPMMGERAPIVVDSRNLLRGSTIVINGTKYAKVSR